MSIGCGSTVGSSGSGSCTEASATATASVTLTDNAFQPACITVPVGTKVTWTNNGSPIHTVTSEPGAPETFDSGAMGSNGIFSFTFAKAETVDYVCTPHASIGMRGTLIVK